MGQSPFLFRVLVAARLAVANPRQDPPSQYRGDCAEPVCPSL